MNFKRNYQFIMFAYLVAASCFAAIAFVNAVNGFVFVAVNAAILVPLYLFLAYSAFNKMIKEGAAMKQLFGENQNDGN